MRFLFPEKSSIPETMSEAAKTRRDNKTYKFTVYPPRHRYILFDHNTNGYPLYKGAFSFQLLWYHISQEDDNDKLRYPISLSWQDTKLSFHLGRYKTMGDKHRNELIKRTRLFASLSDHEMDVIISKMIVKQFGKNETILYEEDTNEYMYLILLGKVKAIRTTEDGKEIILAIHQAGNFFGEMSLIDGKTSPASVIATEDSLIAIISKDDFFSIIFSQNKITRNLLEILCSRLRTCWDTIQLLTFNNAAQRLKMLLMMLSDEYGEKTPDGIELNIKLTHQDISDMTGLTRETITRVLDKMQKSGEITILKNRHILLRPDFLKKELNFKT